MASNFYTYENELQISGNLKCPICLDPFQLPLSSVDCGHIFCFQCLKIWLTQKRTCPICRRYFSTFIRMTDVKQRNELDDLLVQCLHCNARNIPRGQFKDHLAHKCSKQIVINQEEEDCLVEDLNSEYLLKMNKTTENRQRVRRINHQLSTESLPIWITIMSSAHFALCLLVLIPIVAIFDLIDIFLSPVLSAMSSIICFIKIHL